MCKLITKDKKLSYTRARQCLVGKLATVAPGLHSLRASGCTKAANENVNERCLKRHGRWKRDEVKILISQIPFRNVWRLPES